LIDISHLLASTHAAGIASARQVTTSVTALVSVMVEWCAIALITVPDSHKLDSADIFAKLETKLWCHGHTIFFWNLIFVPKLLLRLCVKNTTNMPHSCRATHWVNRVWAGEPHLPKLRHSTDEAWLETHAFHSQTFTPEAATSSFRFI